MTAYSLLPPLSRIPALTIVGDGIFSVHIAHTRRHAHNLPLNARTHSKSGCILPRAKNYCVAWLQGAGWLGDVFAKLCPCLNLVTKTSLDSMIIILRALIVYGLSCKGPSRKCRCSWCHLAGLEFALGMRVSSPSHACAGHVGQVTPPPPPSSGLRLIRVSRENINIVRTETLTEGPGGCPDDGSLSSYV